MRTRRNLVLLTPFLLWAACGGDDAAAPDGGTPPGTDSSTPGTDSGVDAGLPGGERFTLTWGPVDANVSEEDTRCVVKRLGNPAPIHVGAMINELGTSSHHMVIYRTNDTVEQVDPFPCTPFVDTLDPSTGSPLAITQRHSETISLPQGVGYTLEANQMIRIELHYINTTAAPTTVTGSTTMVTIPDADFTDEAGFLFIGNPDIDIPARSTATLGPSYFPLPGMLDGVNFFGVTGHTHQWGTNVFVETSPSAGGTGTPVYDVPGWNWSEPDTVYHDPPFVIPSGGGFRFTCEWDNVSDSRVRFGESANAEMCFFWAYYYPDQGSLVCFHSDAYSFDGCCPGNPLCSIISSMF